jgi:hypothetical protein
MPRSPTTGTPDASRGFGSYQPTRDQRARPATPPGANCVPAGEALLARTKFAHRNALDYAVPGIGWGAETYARLLAILDRFDPERIFAEAARW